MIKLPSHLIAFYFFYFYFWCLLGLHPRHMEIPRLGVQSEPQLLAYAKATATQDPSYICDLRHSSWQRQILNPLSEVRDWTYNLMVPVGFISAMPWWELLVAFFLFLQMEQKSCGFCFDEQVLSKRKTATASLGLIAESLVPPMTILSAVASPKQFYEAPICHLFLGFREHQ